MVSRVWTLAVILTGFFTAGVLAPPLHDVGEKPIWIRASKRVCLAPCDLDVTIVVPKHADNRRLDVAWGSVDNPGGGSFSRMLEGDRSQSVWTRQLTLGAGAWSIVGAVTRVTGGKVTQEEADAWEVEVR